MATHLENLVMKSKMKVGEELPAELISLQELTMVTEVWLVMMMTKFDGMAKNMVGKELVPRKLLERFIMLSMFEIMA
jgi:hypothetical protein